MQKVITINLNGNAYQLDQSGYESLRAYLEHAEGQLGSNPDKTEIIRDVEQSIGEKCARFLGPGKTVVSALEVEQVLREVGPVEGGAAPSTDSAPARPSQGAGLAGAPPPKRLYQIREGAMLSGVCNGIAAHFNLDPTIVRLVFVVTAVGLLVIDHGDLAWLVVVLYVLLMFLVPYARTSEQLAAAQGTSEGIPYKVQKFVVWVQAKFGGRHQKAY